jgi:hypothetical protein
MGIRGQPGRDTKADPAATGKQILKEASAGIPDNAEASDGFAAALSAGG